MSKLMNKFRSIEEKTAIVRAINQAIFTTLETTR